MKAMIDCDILYVVEYTWLAYKFLRPMSSQITYSNSPRSIGWDHSINEITQALSLLSQLTVITVEK